MLKQYYRATTKTYYCSYLRAYTTHFKCASKVIAILSIRKHFVRKVYKKITIYSYLYTANIHSIYMLQILLILWGSVALGYALRRWPQAWVGRLLTLSVWFMLFVIGIEIGGNEVLVNSLALLGVESLLLTLITTLCCSLGALWLWKRTQHPDNRPTQSVRTPRRFSLRGLWRAFHESIIILVCFSGGCVLGYLGIDQYLPHDASYYALCLLLVCVGFNIGQNEELRRSLKHIKKSYILLPIITIVGTWVGALLTSHLLSHRSLTDWLAVSSGFGYYSLSSILITEVRGIELGTVALMYNVMREMMTLLFAPLLLKLFGPLAPISIGGATTADTTLPTISRICGTHLVPIAICHGLVVDLSVPLLVPFFCAL